MKQGCGGGTLATQSECAQRRQEKGVHGVSPWLANRIRKETGCTVKLFKWKVRPLSGSDWLDRFIHEPPQLPRVPTVGMPGMLPVY